MDWVDTGAEALKWLDAQPFDLIVLDYRLPDTDGIELMKAFRGRGLETPVIFVTTADSVQLAVEAMKLGAEDFVHHVGFWAHFLGDMDVLVFAGSVAAKKAQQARLSNWPVALQEEIIRRQGPHCQRRLWHE